ncbi:MAG: hypothetical protein QOG59_2790 [Solirubrobacteraceae bacterium]|nr:hypothetical protein [Solirubrobacteraceae bacterium]
MGKQRTNKSTFEPGQDVPEPEPTVELSRARRADQARRAARSAERVEQARAAGQDDAVRYWMHEYRRAAMQCRLLGERVRRAGIDSAYGTADGDPTVVALAPRSALDHPSGGKAA